MWNERYAQAGFAYGTEPNAFLQAHAHLLSSPVLSLAEGEGRNAVFLAGLGLEVLGVDGSAVGLAKALELARARGVTIQTLEADLAAYEPGENAFGGVVSIFAHLPGAVRRALHRRVVRALRPGGVLLLEAYTPAQVHRDTGGPRDPDLCMSVTALREELAGCELEVAWEGEREVVEGRYHTGIASVVQVVARKQRPAGGGG